MLCSLMKFATSSINPSHSRLCTSVCEKVFHGTTDANLSVNFPFQMKRDPSMDVQAIVWGTC